MATEVAILGAVLYGLCGRKATLNEPACLQKMIPAYVPSTGTDTQALERERERSSRGGRLTQLRPFFVCVKFLPTAWRFLVRNVAGDKR